MAFRSPLPDIERTLGLTDTGARRRRSTWIGGIVTIASMGYIAFTGLGASDEPNYRTIPVKQGALVVLVSATGRLEAVDEVDVGAEISGRVLEIDADFGQRVNKEQRLARLSTDELDARRIESQAQLSAAKAGVLRAEADLADAERQADRARALARTKSVSQAQLDETRTAVDRARAGLASAQAQVSIASAALSVINANIAKADIRSPIDGVVLHRAVEVGQTLTAGFQTPVLFTLAADLQRLELRADIDEADIGQVQPGLSASFTVDAFPDRVFEARIETVRPAPKPTSDAGGGNDAIVIYEAILSVENSHGLLRPGLTAAVDITVNTANDALQVANDALRFSPIEDHAGSLDSPGLPDVGRVYVLGRNGQPEPRDLRLGATDGEFTQVMSGDLRVGDEVLVGVAPGEDGAS